MIRLNNIASSQKIMFNFPVDYYELNTYTNTIIYYSIDKQITVTITTIVSLDLMYNFDHQPVVDKCNS